MNINFKSILIAPDKFKGSLSAQEFCAVAEREIYLIDKDAHVVKCPLADGGEGSLDCFTATNDATVIEDVFCGPDFKRIHARYAVKENIAFIETAETAGLIKAEYKNPCITTTFGVGQQISAAVSGGADTIYLAVGGSATNDAGCGMAAALGFTFYDANGKSFIPVGGTLNKICKITKPEKNLDNVKFVTLCDVKNPLFGENGAAFVYAEQKGATDSQIQILDNNLRHFNKICNGFGKDYATTESAGAAGGLGAGAMFFLNSKIQSGTETIFNLVDLNNKIGKADLIITGEGKIDKQSKLGKVVFSLKELCKDKKTVAFCGVNKLGQTEANDDFQIIEINKNDATLEYNISHTKQNLQEKLRSFFVL